MKLAASIAKPVTALLLLAVSVTAGLPPADAAPKKGGPGRVDRTPPTITCPSEITTDATSPFGAGVWFTATATDDRDLSPTVTASPAPGTFAVGTTTVMVTARDDAGNTSTKSFPVTVRENAIPRTYGAYWMDWDEETYFVWVITVAADGTVSGSGTQTKLLPDPFVMWSTGMPAGLSGTGVVSGTISSDGSCRLESSCTYWRDPGEWDENGNPVYREVTETRSVSLSARVGVSGNLIFGQPSLVLPAELIGTTYWVLQ